MIRRDEIDDDDARLLASTRPPDWRNPTPSRRYDMVVIGGGPAGVAIASRAAARGARVALVERDRLGGACLHTGCVPSKTLLRTAQLYSEMRRAGAFGARTPKDVVVDFAAAMERMRRVRARLGQETSARDLSDAGIHVFFGEGSFSDHKTIIVEKPEARLRFETAVVATGSRPVVPSIPGLADAGYQTHETIFDLRELPRRLLVVGGGPQGCELGQAFQRLGAQVTLVQAEPMFLRQEERDAAQILAASLARDGIAIQLDTEVTSVRAGRDGHCVQLARADGTSEVVVDEILIGVGRTPNVEGLGLDRVGVAWTTDDGVTIDDFQRTTNRRIFASGDVWSEHRFAHIEEASAKIVVENALFSGHERLSALAIPWCTYTDPEIAHVGAYVREAGEKGITLRTFTIMMHDVDRAVIDGEEDGFVKVHVSGRGDRIVGATVVARHAGEMINELTLAISSGLGMRDLARVAHAYPTQASAITMAAEAYVRTRRATKRARK